MNDTPSVLQAEVSELRQRLAAMEAKNRELAARVAQVSANILELTLQTTTDPQQWRLKADWNRPGDPMAVERLVSIDRDGLLSAENDALAYGSLLGKAIFADNVRDIYRLARGSSPTLYVLLAVEDPALQDIRWERLAGPVDGDAWEFLRSSERTPFSLYVPTTTERAFPSFPAEQFKVLVVVASPAPGNRLVAPFSEELAIEVVEQGLGARPWQLLCHVDHPLRLGPPTVGELCKRLGEGGYTGIHVVCHGVHRGGKSVIFLDSDEPLPGETECRAAPIPLDTLIARLAALRTGIPHFAFLSVCDSSAGGAVEVAAGQPWHAALTGLGQRLVRELGVKAVVAMTDRIGQATALGLAKAFYPALVASGEVDMALSRAFQAVWGRDDATTPALYSRVVGRPLFSDSEAALSDAELVAVRRRLTELFATRAPAVGALETQPLAELERLCEQVLELPLVAFARGKVPPPHLGECPFPGLRAFTPDQKQFFRGRDALVTGLVERLRMQSVVCVLGNSGSGKSSVVAAGVIPTLQQRNRQLRVARFTPGSAPEANLAAALASLEGAAAALVYVDQFEEIFTLCTDRAVQEHFLEALLKPARPEFQVILTMRADFLGHCAPFPALRAAVQRQPELVPPMTPEELRGAIEAQAKQAGLRYEAGLLEDIFLDLRREPGVMPLLQHALARLWTYRRGAWLRREDWHQQIGGVAGALQRTAEEVWETLTPEEQAILPRVLTGLTRVGTAGGADTRRRASLGQLFPPRATEVDQQRVRALVEALSGERARLLVTSAHPETGQVVVEVAHEALLSHWSRLRRWLDDARERLQLEEDLRVSAQAWVNHHKQGEAWLEHRGVRLDAVRVLRTRGMELSVEALHCQDDPTLQGSVEDYIAACAAADEVAEQRRVAEERRVRGALLASAAQGRLANQDFLGATALLAEAEHADDVPGFTGLALQVLCRPVPGRRLAQPCPVAAAQWASDGDGWITGDVEGDVRIWEFPASGEPVQRVHLPLQQPIREIRVQPGGEWIAVVTSREVWLIRAPGTAQQRQVRVWRDGDPVAAAWTPDGSRLVVGGNYRARVFESEVVAAGVVEEGFGDVDGRECTFPHAIACLAIAPDGGSFVLGDTDGTLHFRDMQSLEEGHTETVGVPGCYVDAVAWGEEGLAVATLGQLHWLDPDGSRRGSIEGFPLVTSLSFAEGGRLTLTAGSDGLVRVLQAMGERPWIGEEQGLPVLELCRLQLHQAVAALVPGGAGRLLTAGRDGSVCDWPLQAAPEPAPRARLPLRSEPGAYVAMNRPVWGRSGRQVAYCNAEGGLALWRDGDVVGQDRLAAPLVFDPEERRLLVDGPEGTGLLDLSTFAWTPVEHPHVGMVQDAAFSADGRRIVLITGTGEIGTWDADNGWRSLSGHQGTLAAPVLSADGRWVAAKAMIHGGDYFSGGWAWGWDNPGNPWILERGGNQCHVLAFHPSAPIVVGTFDDFCAVGWSMGTGEPGFERAHLLGVIAAAYSSDGRLATGCYDAAVRVWSEDGRMIYLAGHRDHVHAVAWAPDGRTLFTASRDGSIRGWDLELRTERFHVSPDFGVGEIRVSDRDLVAISEDRMVAARWALALGSADIRATGLRLSALERQKWLGAAGTANVPGAGAIGQCAPAP